MIYTDFPEIENALLSVSDNVYHYEALKATPPYIVWAEDNETNMLNTDNKKTVQVIQGTIDLYTLNEKDELAEKIQSALNERDISFSLNSVQYEDETTLIHYEWVFEVVAWQSLP